MLNRPTRIGILQALRDDGSTEAALKYLVLYQNILQKSLEFSFLPVLGADELLVRLQASEHSDRLDASVVTLEMAKFCSEYLQRVRERAVRYDIPSEEPDVIVIVSRGRFSNRHYFIGEENWSIIALGDWDSVMAPPSVVESILTLLVEIGVIAACGEKWPRSHHETKGCLFDFTASLKEARYKVLNGFICAACEQTITVAHSEQLVKDARTLAERNWLGDSEEPSHVSVMARNLGFPLFRTRGFSPSFAERAKSLLEEEGAKEAIKLVFGVLLTGLLFWLGWKK